jgi:hypothetical protein
MVMTGKGKKHMSMQIRKERIFSVTPQTNVSEQVRACNAIPAKTLCCSKS